MGRAPCCEKMGLKKGPWTPDEDSKLIEYIQKHGHGSWRALPKQAGLLRCGKSCRLRWTNYLRPDIKRGKFSSEEEQVIISFHAVLGNRWSAIATHLPGRTDNEIKNYWNTHLKKRLLRMGLDPVSHKPRSEIDIESSMAKPVQMLNHMAQWESSRLEAESRLAKEHSRLASHPNIVLSEAENESADYFLRAWKSEAGEVFRRGLNPPNSFLGQLHSCGLDVGAYLQYCDQTMIRNEYPGSASFSSLLHHPYAFRGLSARGLMPSDDSGAAALRSENHLSLTSPLSSGDGSAVHCAIYHRPQPTPPTPNVYCRAVSREEAIAFSAGSLTMCQREHELDRQSVESIADAGVMFRVKEEESEPLAAAAAAAGDGEQLHGLAGAGAAAASATLRWCESEHSRDHEEGIGGARCMMKMPLLQQKAEGDDDESGSYSNQLGMNSFTSLMEQGMLIDFEDDGGGEIAANAAAAASSSSTASASDQLVQQQQQPMMMSSSWADDDDHATAASCTAAAAAVVDHGDYWGSLLKSIAPPALPNCN